jgi:hypothetical protein
VVNNQIEYNRAKKHFQLSPYYFNLVFPDFSPNLPDFFSIENIQLSSIENKKKRISQICRSYPSVMMINKKKELCISITKKHFQFFPNFPIFRATFPVFLYIKTSYGLLRTLKKKLVKSFQPVPQKKALSVFPEFSIFPGNFSDFFSF